MHLYVSYTRGEEIDFGTSPEFELSPRLSLPEKSSGLALL